jgi:hypothetical protein
MQHNAGLTLGIDPEVAGRRHLDQFPVALLAFPYCVLRRAAALPCTGDGIRRVSTCRRYFSQTGNVTLDFVSTSPIKKQPGHGGPSISFPQQ